MSAQPSLQLATFLLELTDESAQAVGAAKKRRLKTEQDTP